MEDMRLVNGWMLVRLDSERGISLAKGIVVDGGTFRGCKILFRYAQGFTHTLPNHPDPHMFVNKNDVVCVLEEGPSSSVPIIPQPPLAIKG